MWLSFISKGVLGIVLLANALVAKDFDEIYADL
jgi:hypothetical protein